MFKKDPLGLKQRRYIRLDSVFPAEFRLFSIEGGNFLSDWLQGFTNNVSKGGICLEVNNLDPELVKILHGKQARLSLNIEMPVAKSPVRAQANVAWIKEIKGEVNKYLIGLDYTEIDPRQNNRIMRYASVKRLFVPLVLGIVLVLGMGFSINSYFNIRLIRGNQSLVQQLVAVLQESILIKERAKEIDKEREGLRMKIKALQSRIQTAQEEKANLERKAGLEEKERLEQAEADKKMEELNAQVNRLAQEKASLQQELMALQNRERKVSEDMQRLNQEK